MPTRDNLILQTDDILGPVSQAPRFGFTGGKAGLHWLHNKKSTDQVPREKFMSKPDWLLHGSPAQGFQVL